MHRALLAVGISAALCALGPPARATQDAYNEGQRAYAKGDLAAAKEKFKAALQADPGNKLAQNYLAMIAALEKKSGPQGGTDLARQLAGLVLEKVEFKDATLSGVLAFLTQQSTSLSSGKTTANFVVVAPGDAQAKRVTLSLSHVPFLEVLHYIGDLTGLKFSVEKYAIRVTAATAEAPSP